MPVVGKRAWDRVLEAVRRPTPTWSPPSLRTDSANRGFCISLLTLAIVVLGRLTGFSSSSPSRNIDMDCTHNLFTTAHNAPCCRRLCDDLDHLGLGDADQIWRKVGTVTNLFWRADKLPNGYHDALVVVIVVVVTPNDDDAVVVVVVAAVVAVMPI
jgi:hypothetical protein